MTEPVAVALSLLKTQIKDINENFAKHSLIDLSKIAEQAILGKRKPALIKQLLELKDFVVTISKKIDSFRATTKSEEAEDPITETVGSEESPTKTEDTLQKVRRPNPYIITTAARAVREFLSNGSDILNCMGDSRPNLTGDEKTIFVDEANKEEGIEATLQKLRATKNKEAAKEPKKLKEKETVTAKELKEPKKPKEKKQTTTAKDPKVSKETKLYKEPTLTNEIKKAKDIKENNVLNETKEEIDSTEGHKTSEEPLHKRRKNIPKHIKTLVWNEYIGADITRNKCVCCKKESIDNRNFHCGHVIAESKGGDLTLQNLRPICAPCNSSMGTRSMNEFTKEFFGWEM